MTFNGAIYNYPELRAEREKDGIVFRSDPDTVVLPDLHSRLCEAMAAHLHGMFASAIHDIQRYSLHFMARDPLAIKPLY